MPKYILWYIPVKLGERARGHLLLPYLVEVLLVSIRKTIPFGVNFYVLLLPLGFVLACLHVTKTLYDRVTVLFVMKKYLGKFAVYCRKTPTHT